MNLFDLTITQLKRATAIKEQIEDLNRELASILSGSTKPGVAPNKTPTMSSATRAKVSAKLKAYWAAKRAGKK